jgi:hypothetical protein
LPRFHREELRLVCGAVENWKWPAPTKTFVPRMVQALTVDALIEDDLAEWMRT